MTETLRPCIVEFPGCALYECDGALSEAHAVDRFKTEWCSMGSHAGDFTVTWLDPPQPAAEPEPIAAPAPELAPKPAWRKKPHEDGG